MGWPQFFIDNEVEIWSEIDWVIKGGIFVSVHFLSNVSLCFCLCLCPCLCLHLCGIDWSLWTFYLLWLPNSMLSTKSRGRRGGRREIGKSTVGYRWSEKISCSACIVAFLLRLVSLRGSGRDDISNTHAVLGIFGHVGFIHGCLS